MKILLVDDSAYILLICRHALEKSGYDVVGDAYDGEQAVEMARQLKPDLVIVDIALPKINGFDVTKQVLEELPTTYVMGISALDDKWVRDKATEAGCHDFLTKPFDALELIDRVNRLKISDKEVKYG